jgi:hypothetical protein
MTSDIRQFRLILFFYLAMAQSKPFFPHIGNRSRTHAREKGLQVAQLMFAAKINRLHPILAITFSNLSTSIRKRDLESLGAFHND